MAVTTTNLYFSRGDTFPFSCLAQDYSQAIINLTGIGSIKCTVKRNAADSVQLFQKTVGSGIVVASPTLGTFTVTFAGSDTAALPQYPQTLVYDVVVVNAGGLTTSVQSGAIYLAADVTP